MVEHTAIASGTPLVSSNTIKNVLGNVPTGLLIDGQWRESSDRSTFGVENPATGEVLVHMASAQAQDAREAMDAAARAQDRWARTSTRERSDILRRAFDAVQQHRDDIALLMTLEMGKPLAESEAEVRYGSEFLRWFSEEAVRHSGRNMPAPEGHMQMLVRHKPVGPCYLITPWNFPLAMATRKVAPALAAGCTMVLKSAALAPLTSQYFAQLLLDSGLPDGVLNVVASDSAAAVSEPIMKDRRLRKVSFTGSTPVGKLLMKQAADHVLRTSMELGGNAPLLVFDDADLDKAVAGAVAAKMRNMGQACTAANRILVQESVAEQFAHSLAEQLASLPVGYGILDDSKVGPLVNATAVESVCAYVQDAVQHGARVLTGGHAVGERGYFYAPTVLVDVPEQARVCREEIFGPVAPIITFKDEDDAVRIANATEYGLAAYVFTENYRRVQRMADRIESGLLGLNLGVLSNAAAPFGGVKHSGVGREGGVEGIAEYTATQYVGLENPWGC